MVHIVGKGNISAKVIADSISPAGKRITTFELEYPRFIHAELLTHRLLSRNAASSRAIPVPKMIENIKANTAMPIHWGANQKGMQADNECDNQVVLNLLEDFDNPSDMDLFTLDECGVTKEQAWQTAMGDAVTTATAFNEAGYHKQIVNRLLEPFQFMKVVCTATEYDNFFWLRNHKDAQPEIKELAACMLEAQEQSKPIELRIGEWHLPYVTTLRDDTSGVLLYFIDGTSESLQTQDAQKVSASCCAQVSYRLADSSLEKAIKIYDMLVTSSPVHASPFEHAATPMDEDTHIDSEGVTGYNNSLGYVSGNFAGWVQFRQLIPENTCWNYESK